MHKLQLTRTESVMLTFFYIFLAVVTVAVIIPTIILLAMILWGAVL